MRILVLGGTVFLGRSIVDAAIAHHHEITIFNRGRHNAHLYPDVEKLRGDRDGGLAALKGRTWDAVVDTCGCVPRLVRDSTHLLADAIDHYTFVSSISVYNDLSATPISEDAAVSTVEDVTAVTYGPLKALCEQAAEEVMPGRVLCVRAGLIVGPHDPTDRFTYWPVRVARGGEVLVPPTYEAPVQFIDVRDLAQWVTHMAEQKKAGVYNATGPAQVLTFGQFLDACKAATGSNATFTSTSAEFLAAQEVTSLPLWGAMLQANIAKATANGLTLRPLSETICDTVVWAQSRPGDHKWQVGLPPKREAEVLTAWRTRSCTIGAS